MDLKIKTIKCTCHACPSQWEGITEKGEAIYIRYRGGWLSIQLSKPDGTIRDAINNDEMLYQERIGDVFDGVISIEEVMELMRQI
jgi:hypothetical protein